MYFKNGFRVEEIKVIDMRKEPLKDSYVVYINEPANTIYTNTKTACEDYIISLVYLMQRGKVVVHHIDVLGLISNIKR